MQSLDGARRFRYYLFLLFTLDIFFMGSGVDYAVMGMSPRKIFLVGFAIVSTYIFFRLQRQAVRRDLRWIQLSAFVIFVVAWVVVIPVQSVENFSYSIFDALPLIALGIFLLSVDFGKDIAGWVKIRTVVFISAVSFLLLHAILYLLSRSYSALLETARDILMMIWESPNRNIEQFVFVNPMPDGAIRIYFGSSFFILFGLYFFAQKYKSPIKNRLILRVALFMLTLIALWSTNTRSLILGALVFMLLSPVSNAVMPNIRKSFFALFFMISLPFFLSFILLPAIDPSFLEMLGTVRAGSDDLRAEQLWPLFHSFISHPILGKGFGASVSIIRLEEAPYAYELSILALFMKLGLAGFFVGCIVLANAMHSAIPNSVKRFPKEIAPLYCLYFSYIVSCVFNPYMFGLFGTFFSLFLLFEFVFVMGIFKSD
jgi:hypothetical protein